MLVALLIFIIMSKFNKKAFSESDNETSESSSYSSEDSEEDLNEINATGNFLIEKFNDHNIKIRKKDGYILASSLCNAGGKEFNKYYKLKRTKKLVKKMAKEQNNDEIVIMKKGGNLNSRGSWIHPLLAINLCQWISVDFAYWAAITLKKYINGEPELLEEIVNNYHKIHKNNDLQKVLKELDKIKKLNEQKDQLLEEKDQLLEKKDEKIDTLKNDMLDMKLQMEELIGHAKNTNKKVDKSHKVIKTIKKQNTKITKQNKQISKKLDIAVEDRSPKDNLKKKQLEQLIILKNPDGIKKKYYVIRRQKQSVNQGKKSAKKSAKKDLSDSDVELETIIKIDYHPNAKSLWNSFRKIHKKKLKFKTLNWFSLDGITEKEFIKSLKKHSENRKNVDISSNDESSESESNSDSD
jgi:hypothetical protein